MAAEIALLAGVVVCCIARGFHYYFGHIGPISGSCYVASFTALAYGLFGIQMVSQYEWGPLAVAGGVVLFVGWLLPRVVRIGRVEDELKKWRPPPQFQIARQEAAQIAIEGDAELSKVLPADVYLWAWDHNKGDLAALERYYRLYLKTRDAKAPVTRENALWIGKIIQLGIFQQRSVSAILNRIEGTEDARDP